MSREEEILWRLVQIKEKLDEVLRDLERQQRETPVVKCPAEMSGAVLEKMAVASSRESG